eukprot:GILK01010029.1.p1 GENE.GILK01010029.1~~GILK01010029.1.p1  ORF type:complete len:561 (+),score=110.22 GILK01010029.1:55-1737(+)
MGATCSCQSEHVATPSLIAAPAPTLQIKAEEALKHFSVTSHLLQTLNKTELFAFASQLGETDYVQSIELDSSFQKRIDETWLKDIAKSLEVNHSVKKIEVTDLELSVSFIESLARVLAVNKCLKFIKFKNCKMSDAAICTLAQGLCYNSTLETLEIICDKESSFSLTQTGFNAMRLVLEENTILTVLKLPEFKMDIFNQSLLRCTVLMRDVPCDVWLGSDRFRANLPTDEDVNTLLSLWREGKLDLQKATTKDSGLARSAEKLAELLEPSDLPAAVEIYRCLGKKAKLLPLRASLLTWGESVYAYCLDKLGKKHPCKLQLSRQDIFVTRNCVSPVAGLRRRSSCDAPEDRDVQYTWSDILDIEVKNQHCMHIKLDVETTLVIDNFEAQILCNFLEQVPEVADFLQLKHLDDKINWYSIKLSKLKKEKKKKEEMQVKIQAAIKSAIKSIDEDKTKDETLPVSTSLVRPDDVQVQLNEKPSMEAGVCQVTGLLPYRSTQSGPLSSSNTTPRDLLEDEVDVEIKRTLSDIALTTNQAHQLRVKVASLKETRRESVSARNLRCA